MMVAQADTVLLCGRITTLSLQASHPPEVSALAIRSGKIHAIGSDEDVMPYIGEGTRVVDLGGRRVVPGLVDSHVHFVRAGRTWDDEVRWEDMSSLREALEAVRRRADEVPKGSWIRIIGGFSDAQFSEGRGPTREELDTVAPEHPVYVQAGYKYAVFNGRGIVELDLDEERIAASPTPDSFERDEAGKWTGRGNGGMPQLSWFYDQLPKPTFEQQVASTLSLSREFARLGITAAYDGGGVNSGPDIYGPIYEAWRRGGLKTRLRMFKHATRAGTEHEDFAGYLRFAQPRSGDEMLKFSGIGEVVMYRSHDHPGEPADASPEAIAEARGILLGFAQRGWTVQIHAFERDFLLGLLGMMEEIHEEFPIDRLRWAIVHGNSAAAEDIPRFKRLGVGLLLQAVMRFNGEVLIAAWGQARMAQSPEVRAFLDAGVPVGLGSDGMRGASYNPWASIAHFITGLTVGGTPTLTGENLLSREEALAGYSRDGAWFTHEDDVRGQLIPGHDADVAILSADYFHVPLEEISGITSELTLVRGEVAWESGRLNP